MASTASSGTSGQLGGLGRLGRVGWAIVLALLVLAIAAGIWPLTGLASTWVPALLVPAAVGLPYLLPPVRLLPLGDTTALLWIVDLAGAATMLLAAALWARAAWRRHPQPGLWRAFGRGLWITVVAVVLGNVVRSVAQSFVMHSGIDVYLIQLLGGILVSALTGVLLGVLVGIVAAAFAGRRRHAQPA